MDHPIDTHTAELIYDILVDDAGAREDERRGFVAYVTKNLDHAEWRFQGDFGYGGKFYAGRGCVPGVGYYIEDYSLLRERIRRQVNDKIAALFAVEMA
jgi:hypothetical protein